MAKKKATREAVKKKPRATLSDRQARGGVIGAKGYGFQAAYIVSRIPLWLADGDFVQFLQEGAGDVDIRFDRDDGVERWYVQLKNHQVGPSEAREVFGQFRKTDEGTPDTYTQFTLACPGLNDDLKSLRGAIGDLRGVGNFYDSDDTIIKNTWEGLKKRVTKLELPIDAEFLVGKVHFDTDLAGLTDDTSLCDLFVARLLKLEQWDGVRYGAAIHAYEKLALRAHREIRRVCERDSIERDIRNAVEELPAQPEGIPSAPTPYFAYRYPMPEHWTGRLDEMDRLDGWLAKDDVPMACLIAIGGTGKSSLAWAWLRRRAMAREETLKLGGIFHCSFYEGEVGFRRFLEHLCVYMGVWGADDPVTALIHRLAEERILLVLDGFERLLCAYSSVDAALLPERTAEELEASERRCADLTTARFLRGLVTDTACKTLVTSRLVPQELDKLAGWDLMELPGLAPDDAVAYLRASGIRGTRGELRAAAEVYGYHPLSLSKLVEALHYDVSRPDDVRQALCHDVTLDLEGRRHHILKRAYETLPEELGQFLSALAALRGEAAMEVVRLLAGETSDEELSAKLRRLEEDRWITWERERQTLGFHPVVRRYAYERLVDKKGTHSRLREFFAEVPGAEKVESLDDLGPVVELYHHTVRAGLNDEAHDLLRERLVPNPLHFRFGAYRLMIELTHALFPGGEALTPSGEASLPMLSKEGDRGWTLHSLAASYCMSGQPRRAVPLNEAASTIAEELGRKEYLTVALSTVASAAYLPLGALAAAEKNHRRSIALWRELEDGYREGVGHQELGRLLAYSGESEQALEELEAASVSFRRTGQKQSMCVVDSYRALRALLMGDADAALKNARQAYDSACSGEVELDRIRAEWLLGAAHRALGELDLADTHLSEALRRCRRIGTVEFEPDILLELARLRHGRGERDEALAEAREALEIADRCEYRLKQADYHNFLAQVAMEEGDTAGARQHAETARERAECDGPPHRYEAAYQEAERLLAEIESRRR